jgi:hypothetical protein
LRELTSAEFQARMKTALAHFSSDWSRQRANQPALFPDSQPDLYWWEAFAEFAQAEIFNESLARNAPVRG